MDFDFLMPSTFAPSPLSLEEISATQVKVLCQTNVPLKGFGYLDPSLGQADLPEGIELELPLWAVHTLLKKKYITVRVPSKFKENYREVLKADPTVVDLNRLSSHFYQTGLHLSTLYHRKLTDAEQIAEILPDVLRKRILTMADSYAFVKAMKSSDDGSTDAGSLMKEGHMDALEKSLFEAAKKGAKQMSNYFGKR